MTKSEQIHNLWDILDKNTKLYGPGTMRYSIEDLGGELLIAFELCPKATKPLFIEHNTYEAIEVLDESPEKISSEISELLIAIDSDCHAIGLKTLSTTATIPIYSFKHKSVFYPSTLKLTIALGDL